MLGNIGKCNSFLAINDKYFLEKIFHISSNILKFLFLTYSICDAKKWCASPVDFRLHVMTLKLQKKLPLNGYSANIMK